ncbi:MAG: molybdenum cofactor biosynthesis protein MoaE [Magnetococcus sp. YQC-9]
MIRIQTEDFSLEEEVKALTAGRTVVGGVVSFIGTVRDYTSGDRVVAMELEHYPGMTEAELSRIEAAARVRFHLEELLVVHRVGRLGVADNIVLVVAAARHRADAFDACRYMIDHLKLYATFWKKEITAEGGERWVDACPGCEAAAGVWGREEALALGSGQGFGHRHDCAHGSGQGGDLKLAGRDHGGHDGHGKHGHDHGKHEHGHDHGEHGHGHGEHGFKQGGHGHRDALSWRGLRVGVLTLSDSRDLSSDKSGDALEGEVLKLGGSLAGRMILPDDAERIADQLVTWADDSGMDVILTTGGTGPGPRDVTPEATRAVCTRELPGFAELIRQAGLEQLRSAVLTRGITALRGSTLVVNLPGSTRGAVHSLAAVADLVPHVLRMARGGGH